MSYAINVSQYFDNKLCIRCRRRVRASSFIPFVFSFLEIEIFFAIIYNRITYNWIIYRDVEWLENGTLIVDIWRMKLKSLGTAELLNLSFERCV